jgi:hypothetical protein
VDHGSSDGLDYVGLKEVEMIRLPHVDDFVRLNVDIPELALHRGDVGVVRSTWFSPTTAYEVEFHPVGFRAEARALLLAEQVMVEEGSLMEQESELVFAGA